MSIPYHDSVSRGLGRTPGLSKTPRFPEWADPGLNRGPSDFQSLALPTELSARAMFFRDPAAACQLASATPGGSRTPFVNGEPMLPGVKLRELACKAKLRGDGQARDSSVRFAGGV